MEEFKKVVPRDVRDEYYVMLAYGDMHIPYHNRKCRDILLALIDEIKPDYLLSGGDDIDAESVAFYDKDTSQESTLERDLEAFYRYSEYLCKNFPKMRKIYLQDNHLYKRLEKHKKIVKWLQNMKMFTFESIIKAEEYGWDVHNEFVWMDTVLFTHGHEESGNSDSPVNTVRANYKRNGYSIVRFHTHVTGIELHRHRDKDAIVYQMGGFLDRMQAHYVKSKKRLNWTTSAGVFYLNHKTNEFYVEPILFFNDSVVFRGKKYTWEESGNQKLPAAV